MWFLEISIKYRTFTFTIFLKTIVFVLNIQSTLHRQQQQDSIYLINSNVTFCLLLLLIYRGYRFFFREFVFTFLTQKNVKVNLHFVNRASQVLHILLKK